MNSTLYVGNVRHRRFTPVDHTFNYGIFMPLIDLDELEQLHQVGIRLEKFSSATFKRSDYLGGGDIKTKAQDRIAELTGERLTGRVMLLCQLRYFGLYFNPVNFYYLYDHLGEQRWQLPLMTMKTAVTIYWQALKLWLKRAPIYAHPPADKD